MSEHTCHAEGCHTPLPAGYLLCRRHWFMLPSSMRDTLNRLFQPGQWWEGEPSLEYALASARARIWLSVAEGHEVPGYLQSRLRLLEHRLERRQKRATARPARPERRPAPPPAEARVSLEDVEARVSLEDVEAEGPPPALVELDERPETTQEDLFSWRPAERAAPSQHHEDRQPPSQPDLLSWRQPAANRQPVTPTRAAASSAGPDEPAQRGLFPWPGKAR